MEAFQTAVSPQPDFDAINADAREHLTTALGDSPALMRMTNKAQYSSLVGTEAIHIARMSYALANLNEVQAAQAMHMLAQDALDAGYSKEAVQIAMTSNGMGVGNQALIADNLTLKAYAFGMIDGQYEIAYQFLKTVEDSKKRHDLWDENAHIEMLLNRGRLYNRIGAANPRFYAMALADFEEALHASHSPSFTHNQISRYSAHLNYEFTKTLIQMARINPHAWESTMLANRALGLIDSAVHAPSHAAISAFERASMLATKGNILGLTGNVDGAMDSLQEALHGQLAASPTNTPRIVATQMKMHLLEGATAITGSVKDSLERLVEFHGTTDHPQIRYYISRVLGNSAKPATVFVPPRDQPAYTATVHKLRPRP